MTQVERESLPAQRFSPSELLGKENHECYGKTIVPEKLLTSINEGAVVYAELDRPAHFDFRLISQLQRLKSEGLPLAVCARSIGQGDNLFSQRDFNQFLSHLTFVDHIVAPPQGQDFTLSDKDEAYSSNVHFVTSAIGSTTRDRIRSRVSSYYALLDEADIRIGKGLRPKELPEVIAQYQQSGQRIVVVTGVFDILHPGHIAYLEEARTYGDVLIVLTNSDASVKLQAKAHDGDRPIHPLAERLAVLAAVDLIAHVVPFDQSTAVEILEQLPGAIFVKTEKESRSEGVQREIEIVLNLGGKAVFLPPITDPNIGIAFSSTEIITNVRNTNDIEDGAVSIFEGYPSLAREKILDVLTAVAKWDERTSSVSKLRTQLKKKYDTTQEDCRDVELQALDEICRMSNEVSEELGCKRDYHNFLVPEILGKELGLDIRTIAVQHNRSGSPSEVMNILKLANGNIVIFSAGSHLAIGPFAFEKEFWKQLPHNTNYIAYDRSFPLKRIFVHNQEQHQLAIALKIFLEEYKLSGDIETALQYRDTIAAAAKKVWETLTEFPYVESIEDLKETEMVDRSFIRTNGLPGIVAHGGSSVLAMSGEFAQNSRAGIIDALEKDVDAVEIDVVACKDGWVVSHDRKLEVATVASGLTTDLTQDELQQIDYRLKNGQPSGEKIMTLVQALKLVSAHRRDNSRLVAVKLDIKFSDRDLEQRLIDILEASELPIEQVLMTSQVFLTEERIHRLCPNLPFELNTVSTNLYLTAYGLMDKELMPGLFVDYVRNYAPRLNAKTVSLMRYAMDSWGEEVAGKLIHDLCQLGLETQVWTIGSLAELRKYAALGATYVLMDKPKLIAEAVALKQFSNPEG